MSGITTYEGSNVMYVPMRYTRTGGSTIPTIVFGNENSKRNEISPYSRVEITAIKIDINCLLVVSSTMKFFFKKTKKFPHEVRLR
jgi:hypothetical protein